MAKYSIEFREAVIQKVMSPNAMPVSALSKENEDQRFYADVPGNNRRSDSWSVQDLAYRVRSQAQR